MRCDFVRTCFSRGICVYQYREPCMAEVIFVREEVFYMVTVDGYEHDEQLCILYFIEIKIIYQ